MNALQIFENPEFGKIRTVEVDGEPWLVGKDVAQALGYSDTSDALKKHVDSEDKLTRRFADSGQNREMYIINESGLGRERRNHADISRYQKHEKGRDHTKGGGTGAWL